MTILLTMAGAGVLLGIRHAIEDTVDLDVFNPPRQDWLSGTDAYLRK